MLLLHLSPVILVLGAIVLFRHPPMQAALAGALLALVLWLLGAGMPYSRAVAHAIAQDALLLFASVAAVIAPGLLLMVLLAHTDAHQALNDWVRALGLQAHGQVIFIVLGVAPLLESMTGFGVSWIAVVPLLLALFAREQAARMALSGMAVMPWGTLGLATVTGAALAGLPAGVLGMHSALSSAPVFVGLALMAVGLAGFRQWQALLAAAASALLFVLLLYGAARFLGAEVAGLCAGAVMVLAGLLWAGKRPSWPRAAWPYALLFASVLGIKLLLWACGGGLWTLQGAQARWQPLASPGMPLLLVCAVLLWRQGVPAGGAAALWQAWRQRATRPLLTILCFLLMSQIMVKAGFLGGVRVVLAQAHGAALPPLVALLGGLGGYLTGSNVGGNVLMMPAIAQLNQPFLAAVLNSAAGHAALGSLPMVSVLAGLAKLGSQEEQALARFALGVVVLNVLLVAMAGTLWVALL